MSQTMTSIASDSVQTDMANRQRVLRLFVITTVAWLPALITPDVVRSAAALFPLANSTNPYFVPGHAWTLYLWAPVVVASACLLFLSPGLFLSIAVNSAHSIGHWILSGLALSLIVISVVTGIVQWIMGNPLRDGAFAAVVVGCALGCFGFLLVRLGQSRPLAWPLGKPYAGSTVLSMVISPVMVLIAFAPKFYWENFNGDGAHAFESARLLLVQSLLFGILRLEMLPHSRGLRQCFSSFQLRGSSVCLARLKLPHGFHSCYTLLRFTEAFSHLLSMAGQRFWVWPSDG